ncbi:LLM class F420-dependent oxidoreductase [Prauserella cavernicola]|uniref:LLM class F420-dependent oxidoreductase n=1 Tax=Prauserella cavernicola TaxID=2800127 RepID=A0A934QNY7_9PSEU|nr:LLM class F420-dependent oxidoreductase [Prauserella cavernicola]MBK1784116.1 LLM class F420-dependent oxidoreductase [Prauserella cavernicola]
MRLGLQIPDFTWPNGPTKLGSELGELAHAADEAGFAYLAVMDHFFQIDGVGPSENDMLEAYTTLGYLAAHTSNAKLLTVVTGAFYRHPGLLAKSVTTLDVLSGGRAILGIGAGWNEEESRGLGFRFPPLKERFEQLEDNLRYCLDMWAPGDGPFEGTHVSAERLLNVPQALSSPHPPIMIGGGGEKKTLRLVARYAQLCNLFAGPELERKLKVLREHCEAEGRDYDDITKTSYLVLDAGKQGEKAGELIGQLRGLAAQGIDDVIGMVPGVPDPALIDVFRKEIIPAVAEL